MPTISYTGFGFRSDPRVIGCGGPQWPRPALDRGFDLIDRDGGSATRLGAPAATKVRGTGGMPTICAGESGRAWP